MRYPKKQPFQCTTVVYSDGREYCQNTRQTITSPDTCLECVEHYRELSKDKKGVITV